MNYAKIYNNLITSRKLRIPIDGIYYEKHHIVMKSMGGSDNNENLVLLTPKEHYIAHFLLWRIHQNGQTAWAFKMMCSRNKKWSARVYESERMKHAMSNRKWSEEAKVRVSGKNSHKFGIKFKHSEETKEKIR